MRSAALSLMAGAGLLAACGGGEGVTGPPPEQPGGNSTTALEVVSTQPPSGATAVEIGAAVYAVFSLPLEPSTLNPATFGVPPPLVGDLRNEDVAFPIGAREVEALAVGGPVFAAPDLATWHS